MNKIWEKQGWHLLWTVIACIAGYFIVYSHPSFLKGEYLLSTEMWFWICVAIGPIHQLFVLLCWRAELHYNKLTNLFGEQAFPLYKKLFAVLILSRPISIILLSISNAGSLIANEILVNVLIWTCTILGIYTGYSVARYFGYERAVGKDHFDPSFIDIPFVKGGIFKYTNNAMYTFGFLGLYIPGLIAYSKTALLAALISHVLIWAHYFFTEKVDFKYIYKKTSNQN